MMRVRSRVTRIERMELIERVARIERIDLIDRIERMAPGSGSITSKLIAWVAAVGLVAMIGLGALSGCANGPGEDSDMTGESDTEHVGGENFGAEHDGAENSESESDDGEESGVLLALDETYDVIRKGARLILRYEAESNSFLGTVQNTTGIVLKKVRVEVHLSNGTELGPTTPVDLAPGETVEVSLAATEEPFTGWTPHAEVGEGEHGSGGEGGEGGGEHGSGGEGVEHGSDSGEHGNSREGSEGDEGGEHGSGG